MSSSKPVFLFVCGGWHTPAAYDKLRVELESRGYEYLCPHLPSLGPDASGVTYEADVEEIRRRALPLFDQGKEVVLVAHSAGGVPAVSSPDYAVQARGTRAPGVHCLVSSFARRDVSQPNAANMWLTRSHRSWQVKDSKSASVPRKGGREASSTSFSLPLSLSRPADPTPSRHWVAHGTRLKAALSRTPR